MLLRSGQTLQPLSSCEMYRLGHALFSLSLKVPPFSLVEASANDSDPVTRNFLTKAREPEERESPRRGDAAGCHELQNARARTASQLCFVGEEALSGRIILKRLLWARTVTLFFGNIV